MYLTGLQVENFQGVVAIDLRFDPEGGLIEFCGKNAQGKTSALDAIWAALGGAKVSPAQPIRKGALHASSTLKTSTGLTVTRKWGPKGTSLSVTGAEGSPQAILDRLYSSLGFEPLAFLGQDAKAQAATLRKLVGLDTTDLDARRKTAFDQRTAINRSLKEHQSRLDAAAHYPDAGTEDVSVSALTEEFSQAIDHNRSNEAARSALADAKRAVDALVNQEIALEEQIETLLQKLAALRQRIAAEKEAVAQQCIAVGALVDRDTADVKARIASAEQTNAQARANRDRAKLADATAALQNQSEHLTGEIEKLDAEKAARLASAKFPVPGLSIDGDIVTLNGVPLAQASTAEAIRTSLGIGAALNPEFRSLRVRNGSELDADNLAVVDQWARENGYQVFIERVAESVHGRGVVITDGRVSEEHLADEKAE